MRKLSIVIVTTVAVLALSAAAWLATARSSRAAEPEVRLGSPQATEARVATVRLVTTDRVLEATGAVSSQLEADVSARGSGRVLSVHANVGDAVRRGQVLVQLDARDLDASVAQARANLRAASVGRSSAAITAGIERSTSRERIAAAEARVAQAQSALSSALATAELVRSGPRKQERAQADIAVTQARANLDLAEANLRRMDALVGEGAISRQQHDIVRTQRDVARTQLDAAMQAQSMAAEGSRTEELQTAQEGVRQAQANLDQARAALRQERAAAMQVRVRDEEVRGADARVGQMRAAVLVADVVRDYATVRAPFDGVVTRRLADPGALATPGTPLMSVQGGAARLEVVVPESALPAARLGTTVRVALDAVGGRELTGRVVEVAPQGDPSSHTFLVKVQLPPDRHVRSGMFGRARLVVGAERRLLAPASAIIERDGLRFAMVLGDDGRARLRLVTVGTAVGDQVPVLSGLEEGERIVAEGAGSLRDGAVITAG